ncbi:hypothetical protein Cs7R123_53790 [Catellatospora sp. TT07R-123]|uniref:DUF6939 family protein n=1 Tax=Catellatospora sp. TT07R-123 TaxID=2733863 RepID=UPI001AFFB8F7|nr:hypothetical protein [Catellatospora sp. TT07R-123]GHJ48037.1 hypothetical protein Cs7R123_53790 [Catellatospora sp. TT07R-123]
MTASQAVPPGNVHVASARLAAATLARRFPDATIVNVTSRGEQPWVRLSPFYPHGGIPVPFTPGVTSMSVEGVWQALKVLDDADVDPAKLAVAAMRGIKRAPHRGGTVRGHRRGLHGTELLAYEQARREIYLPTYLFQLEHRAADEVARLRDLALAGPVVLLDYTVNGDVTDLSVPLSHAALIAAHLTGTWPQDAVPTAG